MMHNPSQWPGMLPPSALAAAAVLLALLAPPPLSHAAALRSPRTGGKFLAARRGAPTEPRTADHPRLWAPHLVGPAGGDDTLRLPPDDAGRGGHPPPAFESAGYTGEEDPWRRRGVGGGGRGRTPPGGDPVVAAGTAAPATAPSSRRRAQSEGQPPPESGGGYSTTQILIGGAAGGAAALLLCCCAAGCGCYYLCCCAAGLCFRKQADAENTDADNKEKADAISEDFERISQRGRPPLLLPPPPDGCPTTGDESVSRAPSLPSVLHMPPPPRTEGGDGSDFKQREYDWELDNEGPRSQATRGGSAGGSSRSAANSNHVHGRQKPPGKAGPGSLPVVNESNYEGCEGAEGGSTSAKSQEHVSKKSRKMEQEANQTMEEATQLMGTARRLLAMAREMGQEETNQQQMAAFVGTALSRGEEQLRSANESRQPARSQRPQGLLQSATKAMFALKQNLNVSMLDMFTPPPPQNRQSSAQPRQIDYGRVNTSRRHGQDKPPRGYNEGRGPSMGPGPGPVRRATMPHSQVRVDDTRRRPTSQSVTGARPVRSAQGTPSCDYGEGAGPNMRPANSQAMAATSMSQKVEQEANEMMVKASELVGKSMRLLTASRELNEVESHKQQQEGNLALSKENGGEALLTSSSGPKRCNESQRPPGKLHSPGKEECAMGEQLGPKEQGVKPRPQETTISGQKPTTQPPIGETGNMGKNDMVDKLEPDDDDSLPDLT